jgi:hypothetical protein
VNAKGHKATLVASHPGNRNAVQHGVYSPRLIEVRAAELQVDLEQMFDLTVTDRLAVEQLARLQATLEAIDRDLGQRGHVDRRGKPNPLLSYQLRISRRYEAVLAVISSGLYPRSVQHQEDDAAQSHEPDEVVSGTIEVAAESRIIIAAELEREIRAIKPSAVRVGALVALDRIRRQPPTEDDEDIPGRVIQVFD